ncbi:hypothetical protein [Photobacterium damselae]|uniref:Uncharacterized protein n=1 Tax=Photobacterium damselae TaxID=38293 RepID=A0ABD6X7R5_PHODM|nr:hypothetical protein [Photobacterium damselae]OBU43860.1 hypothetical protein AYY27_04515 [Photobacterium damselae]PSU18751.1 hypothetical protein CTM90_01870 [Photobacterium damselae]
MKKLMILFIIISSSSSYAQTSISDTITLNANITDMSQINNSNIKSSIVGSSYKPLVYDNKLTTFRPVSFLLRSESSQIINQYSFNVIYKNMTCSLNNSVVNVPLSLSINGINEQNNKIILPGRNYWYKVTTGSPDSNYNQYISDVYFNIAFGNITNTHSSDLPCYGTVTLLTSIDL